MCYVIGILCLIVLLYLLAIRGRKHPNIDSIKGFSYAHRGLHGKGVPENSLAAFKAAKGKGYGIEFDVHLMKDGNLAVIHDSKLKRTTGADGRIEDLTAEELKNYRLEGTDEQIPTFEEVLDIYDGAAPLVIELKAEDKNHARLADAVCRVLDEYNGAFCIESFDPRCIMWLRKNRPEIIRGQLSCNFMKDKAGLGFFTRFALTHSLFNFLTVPDFIAYEFAHHKATLSNCISHRLWGTQLVGWTLRSREEHYKALSKGWLSIFENFTF